MKLTFINEAKSVVKRVVKSVVKRAVKSEAQTADIYRQNKTKRKYCSRSTKENCVWAFRSVLLTKHDFEKLKTRCPREFEVVISCLSSYVKFRRLSKALLLGIPKMGSFGNCEQKT